MCGIFFYLGKTLTNEYLEIEYNKIQHRGPSNSISKILNIENDKKLFFGFHRLSINGLDESSNQSFEINGIHLICNGEIFNYKELRETYKLNDVYESNSDCEIIIHLYKKFGIEKTIQLLDGEFAFVLYDNHNKQVFISRDQLGIRSLFIGKNNDEYIISSEVKSINESFEVKQFEPRSYMIIDIEKNNIYINNYFKFKEIPKSHFIEEEIHIENIKNLMIKAVNKRLMSERNLCCLLSGGLDSTIVSALVAKNYEPYSLNTYSIGMKGSVDLKYSKIAADYIKTNHTIIELSPEDFLGAIEKTIYQIESYDVTTIRASIGNYLVSCYIRDNSEDKVVFCGDVSDEIFGSYRGFYYASGEKDFYDENLKMLENIHYFDVLRSDKSISGAGLEARVPFSDPELIQYVMEMNPRFKMFGNKMEKYILRKAFEDILPEELIWRVKTAFSDGVSSEENPSYLLIQNFMENKYSEEEFENERKKYLINMPYDKESLYYRQIFEKYYPNKDNIIPYFWKQPFMNNDDPSAWQAEKNKKNKVNKVNEILNESK
jgi:asparagine synthase (glutamine-hydrolysing)